MCGRCRCSLDKKQSVEYAERTLQKGVRVDSTFDRHRPRYNVSPGTVLPVLVAGDGGSVVLRTAVWGLVPHFQKSRKLDHYKMFNARSEELGAKPSFAGLVSRNRCVILTEGFYEWESKRVLGKMEKQPYYIYFQGDHDKPAVMALAGLFDVWRDPVTAEDLVTCTVLTTSSNEALRWLHDRMPVILHDDAAAAKWLDVDNQRTITRDMIQPHDRDGGGMSIPIKFHKVTPKMSKASFDGVECVERLRPPTTVTKFFHAVKKRPKAAVAGEDDNDDDDEKPMLHGP